MYRDLKELRVQIDRNIKDAADLKTKADIGERELELVYTKLQEAKMWVGKAMEVNGSPLPQEFRDEYQVN